MPKILENMRDQLLAEAKRQIGERGYEKTTIRSVASACGIASGTVYNYFSSKEMLVASFVAQDWKETLSFLSSLEKTPARDFLEKTYGALLNFAGEHAALFSDKAAVKPYLGAFHGRHPVLRAQLAELLTPLCGSAEDQAFLSQFLAEALLTWSLGGVPFERFYEVVKKLL